jgi:metallo-beta-lactamase class B
MLLRLLLFIALALPATAQVPSSWTTNRAPFRIAGNLYYVGSEDLAAFLVTTPSGNILINANLATSPSQIKHNVEALGFRFEDTKILLNSQAHYDHVAGTAEIQRLTHAKVEVLAPDVSVAESGGKDDFLYWNRPDFQYPPFHVDHALHDGERVTLGGTTLTAHLTPGHTKGTTTWTMQVTDQGRTENVVIIGGAAANPGSDFFNQPRYPTQAKDFADTFRILRSLPCDIFLGAHGQYFHLKEKFALLQPGKPNPFIDPQGYKAFIDEYEKAFQKELERQKASHI